MSIKPSRRVVERVLSYGLTTPSCVALVDAQQQLTYLDLANRVTTAGRGLRNAGVGPGDRVGIALPRSIDAVIAVLAVHLCRAAYVPIDLDQPAVRINAVIDLAEVELIVVSDSLQPPGWDGKCRTVSFCSLFTIPVSSPTTLEFVDASMFPCAEMADTAYVIFTSGSTGAPKGVEIDHANLDALLTAWHTVMGSTKRVSQDEVLMPDRQSVSLWLSALSFDASVAEIFWPLYAGGTLAISSPNRGLAGFGDGLGTFIRKHNVTHIQCTPTRAKLLLADVDDRASLEKIEHFVVGGEALPSSLAQQLLDAGVQRLTNAYGPTETTVWAFTHEVTRKDLHSPIVSLGFPLPGVSAFVVDSAGYEVGVSEFGELVIGGPFVSRGYLKRPELTANVFTQRAFGNSDLPSYRTGDLVCVDADGSLAFRGRSDGQVKLRGHRIELGEIEAALGAHPQIHDVIVGLDRRHVAPGEEAHDLIAAVSMQGNDQLAQATLTRIKDDEFVETLKQYLAARLPAIMVPRSIVLYESLPVTTSGKLDRVAVRNILGGERVRPATVQNEDDLIALIEDFRIVLPSRPGKRITAESNFFESGGHSLLVVELVERIARRTHISLPLSALLEAPSPGELNQFLSAQAPRAYNPIVHFSHSIEGLNNKRQRLYFIHGAGGHVLRFQSMASTLADEVELIGIQAIGVEGDQQPDGTAGEMADRYADAIAAFDPGPYLLGGYSDGGILSVHVANRLKNRGGAVRGLIFVDSFQPLPFPKGLMSKLRNVAQNATQRGGLNLMQWVTGAIEGWRTRTQWDSEGAAALHRLGYNDVFSSIERAIQTAPKPALVDAPALLIRTSIENPIRCRDYSVAYTAPSSTSVKWVGVKHDELFKEGSTTELSQLVRAFVVALGDR